ncbi:hypothetical protein BGP77_06625 [Saccharospirillum sp. MSK14-1]|uniref:hypothetical protein n=1 Tax=Saccharospirillum sp. MSK14-1 TaxID=1897632 RepID=UPI000D371C97|nr:hypothetical protein [Saccharospirillum sp. MSK14-1]PTY36954.1 hypothetical protein BGP77_06625 [Saccharospirillum sp. MSK14-1]
MSKFKELLKQANNRKPILENTYGNFPVEIADQCGEGEIAEIIATLDRLHIEKQEIADWDGDSQDDIWKVQRGYYQLLARLTQTYPRQIALGLRSRYSSTRFYTALAFSKSPTVDAIPDLEEYLLLETSHRNYMTGKKALKACTSKIGLFRRLFGR